MRLVIKRKGVGVDLEGILLSKSTIGEYRRGEDYAYQGQDI